MRTKSLVLCAVLAGVCAAQEDLPLPTAWDTADSPRRLGMLTDWFGALPRRSGPTDVMVGPMPEEASPAKTPQRAGFDWSAVANKLPEVPKTEGFDHVDMALLILAQLDCDKTVITRFCRAVFEREGLVLENTYPATIRLMAEKSVREAELDRLLQLRILESKRPGQHLEALAKCSPERSHGCHSMVFGPWVAIGHRRSHDRSHTRLSRTTDNDYDKDYEYDQ